MCDANSFNIMLVDSPCITTEGIWVSYLVANDPPAHLVILLTTSGVVDPLTVTTVGASPTHPVWGVVLPPHRGTLLGGVRHVEVSGI